jgi:hypothetical protein
MPAPSEKTFTDLSKHFQILYPGCTEPHFQTPFSPFNPLLPYPFFLDPFMTIGRMENLASDNTTPSNPCTFSLNATHLLALLSANPCPHSKISAQPVDILSALPDTRVPLGMLYCSRIPLPRLFSRMLSQAILLVTTH